MKKLNTNTITNELVKSSFFPQAPTQGRKQEDSEKTPPQPMRLEPIKPAPQPQQHQPPRKAVATATSKPQRASRPYVRRTFDLYEDQLAYLTRASLEERLAGGEGSMNAMVREAIDAFIEKRSKEGRKS